MNTLPTDCVIRHTTTADLDAVMRIYHYARCRMRQSGNATQWTGGYPSRQVILADIAARNSYVIQNARGIAGVFTFIVGPDSTYADIRGAWPDDDPYGTIHRIAAAPGAHRVADLALSHCLRAGVNIRIDTHADNAPMLGWIAKRGFKYCGIIHVADGTPRHAFQYTLPTNA